MFSPREERRAAALSCRAATPSAERILRAAIFAAADALIR